MLKIWLLTKMSRLAIFYVDFDLTNNLDMVAKRTEFTEFSRLYLASSPPPTHTLFTN